MGAAASAVPGGVGSHAVQASWAARVDQGLGCEQEQEAAALAVTGGGFPSLWRSSHWLLANI